MSTKPYNILLVEDNDVDARVITESLTKGSQGDFVIQRAERLKDALEKLRTQAIDLVLLDFMLPDSEGMATFTAVRKEAPNVPVVALTGMSDEAIAIEAVRQGAQDFLVKGQAQPKILHRAIRYAIERHKVQSAQLKQAQGEKTGKMIAFIGARGGVGTTTVALNIAAALAKKHKEVVAAELLGSYSAFYDHFFYKKSRAALNGLDTLMKLDQEKITSREVQRCLVKLPSGLNLLLGSQRAEDFKELDPDKTGTLTRALAVLGQYVVLDLPSHASAACQMAVKHCDFVVVVIDRTPTCVMAGKVMVDLLQLCGVIPVRIGVVIVNRQPLPISVDVAEVLSTMGCQLVGVVPTATDACSEAQRAGMPMVSNDPQGTASGALIEIADRLATEQIVGR
ncbi:MAG: response regulator [Verrucomicrobia bacterium]|nr:response regulator [Verrucomicrobiota bacterium]